MEGNISDKETSTCTKRFWSSMRVINRRLEFTLPTGGMAEEFYVGR